MSILFLGLSRFFSSTPLPSTTLHHSRAFSLIRLKEHDTTFLYIFEFVDTHQYGALRYSVLELSAFQSRSSVKSAASIETIIIITRSSFPPVEPELVGSYNNIALLSEIPKIPRVNSINELWLKRGYPRRFLIALTSKLCNDTR